MRRRYVHDGWSLHVEVDGERYRLDGDPAVAVVRDLIGEVPALDRFASDVRRLFYRPTPFEVTGEEVLGVLLAEVDR